MKATGPGAVGMNHTQTARALRRGSPSVNAKAGVPRLQKLGLFQSCELTGLRPCSEGRRDHSRGCLSSCCTPLGLLEQNIPKKQGDSFTAPFASSREKADHKYILQLFKRRQRTLQTKFLFNGHRLGEHVYFTYLCIINMYIFLLDGFPLREPSSGGK